MAGGALLVRPVRRPALAAAALVAAAAGCGGGAGPASSTSAVASPPADHACIVPGSPGPSVDWAGLHNPILGYPDAAVKDQALVWAGGTWHMLFSYVTGDSPVAGQEQWDIAAAESPDLSHWSAPAPWSEQAGGMASPDVVRAPDGTFVATYDAPPGESGAGQAKLYYRTSADLVHWSGPQRLAPGLHPDPGVRLIDAALAWTPGGLALAYKVGTTSQAQAFEIAWSRSGTLAGPWSVVGRPDIRAYGDTFENYELVGVHGTWHLVATSNMFDRPWLFTLSGNPASPSSWLHWVGGRELEIPAEPWNSAAGVTGADYEHANSAFLCEDSADGYEYLTYAGSTELTRFGGWGHAQVGIARSRDLVHWSVPPG